jgi:hypothetical protein
LIPLRGCRKLDEAVLAGRAIFLKGTEYRQTDAAFWIIHNSVQKGQNEEREREGITGRKGWGGDK